MHQLVLFMPTIRILTRLKLSLRFRRLLIFMVLRVSLFAFFPAHRFTYIPVSTWLNILYDGGYWRVTLALGLIGHLPMRTDDPRYTVGEYTYFNVSVIN